MVGALLLAGAAHAACYELPFGNPNLADGWGSTCCGRSNPHRGVDFPQGAGTSIPAVSSGRVVVNQWSSCLGNVVVLEHSDGWFSGYAHLESPSPLGVGDSVLIGVSVGRVGSSGSCSTGPHLHLTVSDHVDGWYTGTTVDPYAFIVGNGVQPEVCNLEDDDCDGVVDNAVPCELAMLYQQSGVVAPPTTTDVDGDGTADVCALGPEGFRCWRSTGDGWLAQGAPVSWRPEDGWDADARYGSLRMGDIDADGQADVCGWTGNSIVCARSAGAGFGASSVWMHPVGEAEGFADPALHTSFRLADVDGDGADDLCMLTLDRLRCHLSDGRGFGGSVDGPAWSGDELAAPAGYGSLRMGDIDGDGRADACLRRSDGVDCHRSTGDGFDSTPVEIDWSDSRGFAPLHYWSTFWLADVDGDGRDEPCIRSSSGVRCGISDGTTFRTPSPVIAPLSNTAGWTEPHRYRSIRFEDVDGDGADDVCARSAEGLACWTWDGTASSRIEGPGWTDAQGWPQDSYLSTIRLADMTGDGLADACGRGSQGWRCRVSTGADFEQQIDLGGLRNDDGADAPWVYGSIRSGGRSCGVLDELPCTDAFAGTGDGDGDGLDVPDSGGGSGAGSPGRADTGSDDGESDCGCAADTRGGGRSGSLVVGLLMVWRRRRQKQGMPASAQCVG